MKLEKLVRGLRDIAKSKDAELEFVRRGGNHDLYRINAQLLVVPRHREINERTAKSIIDTAKGA
ncbi:MAG: type II toxin-antitoxin system HicA family toxin [Stackebrandtia sp.]